MTNTELVAPCPFCGAQMLEAEAFRTRSTATYTHADTDAPCPARGVNLVVNLEARTDSFASDNPVRLAMWNGVRERVDLRDRLAAAALPAIVAEAWKSGSPLDGVLNGAAQHLIISMSAYEIADMMMKVRQASTSAERAAMMAELAPEVIEAIRAAFQPLKEGEE